MSWSISATGRRSEVLEKLEADAAALFRRTDLPQEELERARQLIDEIRSTVKNKAGENDGVGISASGHMYQSTAEPVAGNSKFSTGGSYGVTVFVPPPAVPAPPAAAEAVTDVGSD